MLFSSVRDFQGLLIQVSDSSLGCLPSLCLGASPSEEKQRKFKEQQSVKPGNPHVQDSFLS
jgi:hypothetical protein